MTTPTQKPTLTSNDTMFNLTNNLKAIADFRTEKAELTLREKNHILDMELTFYRDVQNLAEINKLELGNGGLQKHTLAILAELKADYIEVPTSKEYRILEKFEFFTKSNVPYFYRSRINKKSETIYSSFKNSSINLVVNNEHLINADLKAELKTAVSEYYTLKGKKTIAEIEAKDCKPMIIAFNKIANDIKSKIEADHKKAFDRSLTIKKAGIKTADIDSIIAHLKTLKAEAKKA